jgi:hypothetical protein
LAQKSSLRYVHPRAEFRSIFRGSPPDAREKVWEALGTRYIRVFHEGTVLNGLEWEPLDEFVAKLRALVPDQIFERCMGN